MGSRLEEALREVARGRTLRKQLDDLEKAHLEQAALLQRLQGENQKIELYRQTARSQEKVIGKLERVLEGSLDEVHKAQQAQVETERLKTENVRLREKCANLVARRKYMEGGDEDLEELRDRLRRKDEEVARLEALVEDLEHSGATLSTQAQGRRELVGQQQGLEAAEGEAVEWKHKCNSVEQRLRATEAQLTENSKMYGKEISNLKVEIAKKDAQILELQLLLKEHEGQ